MAGFRQRVQLVPHPLTRRFLFPDLSDRPVAIHFDQHHVSSRRFADEGSRVAAMARGRDARLDAGLGATMTDARGRPPRTLLLPVKWQTTAGQSCSGTH